MLKHFSNILEFEKTNHVIGFLPGHGHGGCNLSEYTKTSNFFRALLKCYPAS